MMKILSIVLALHMLLFTLFGCAKQGVIKDTATESTTTDKQTGSTAGDKESESQTAMGDGSETMTDPMTDTNDTETQTTDADTTAEDSLFSDFFGKTRDEILEQRGQSTPPDDVGTEGTAPSGDDNATTTGSGNDTSLYYADRYAGYNGYSRYDFGDDGMLGEITLSFDEGLTLDEIASAVTKLNAEAVTQNGETTWTQGDYVYRLTSENNRPVLIIRKGELPSASGTDKH